MKYQRFYYLLFILGFVLFFHLSLYSAPDTGSDKIKNEIDSILKRSSVVQNTWSILIQNKSNTKTYYKKNPDKPMKPASNIKLFTTGCAYNKLGWNYKWNGNLIKDIIRPINKYSINSQADALLRYIGKKFHKSQTLGAGAKYILQWCGNKGIDMTGARILDGSGLSHNNRLTASQIISLLRYMTAHHQKWDDTLAIGGVDGTVARRFRNTPAKGKVFAKTGTLTGVISLSGIIYPDSKDPVFFSFLANNVKNRVSTRKAIDDSVVLIAKISKPKKNSTPK